VKTPTVHVGELALNDSGAFKIGPFGSSLKKTELVESGVPVAGIENVLPNKFVKGFRRFITASKFEELSDYEILPDDVLVTTMGTIGRAASVPPDVGRAIIDSHLFRMRVDTSRVFPPYLCYALNSDLVAFQLARMARGAIMEGLNTTILRECSIPLPEMSEQKRLAEQLKQADRLVRIRCYALELTDTFLPAAFLELFGDPAENPRAFDRVQVEGLFADSRDGAKCGPFGSALKKHEYVASGIPVWTMNNVAANEFLEDGCLYITPQKFEELAAYDAKNGDILISRAGTVGRMAIVRTTHPQSIIHSNIIRLSLNHAKILPIYFVALMTWFAPRIARLKRGQEDAYTFMSTGSLGELQIPLPPFPLQQKFGALVEGVEHLRAV
jgi:type I restriction enzyme S subunit